MSKQSGAQFWKVYHPNQIARVNGGAELVAKPGQFEK